MIIGLVGTRGSGKDTVGAYLIKQHGFERRAFADPLKRSVAALFGIDFSQIDKYKNIPEMTVILTRYVPELPGHKGMTINEFTFREFLQRYGTESHRSLFGEDFWIEQTLPSDGFYSGRKIVVTDVRYQNEAEQIKLLGGSTVEIKRDAPEAVNDPHSSEQIDFETDFVILNNGTIEELYDEIEKLLEAAYVQT